MIAAEPRIATVWKMKMKRQEGEIRIPVGVSNKRNFSQVTRESVLKIE